MLFPTSIRWRLQLWLAFLLVCILGGFGATAYQLHRSNQVGQIDEELQRRVAALGADIRLKPPSFERGKGPPPGDRNGHPPDDHGRRPPFDEGGRPPFHEERGFRTFLFNERVGPPPLWEGHGGKGAGFGVDLFRQHWSDSGPAMLPPLSNPFTDFLKRREIRLSPAVQAQYNEADTNSFYYAIWTRDGTLIKQSSNAPAGLVHPRHGDADLRPHLRDNSPYRESYVFTELNECALVGRSITADLRKIRGFALWLWGAGVAVLALGMGGGWMLTTGALRPIEDIGTAAMRIAAGNLSERVAGADARNELGRLAGVLNSTFARLESAFAQQKQFTADASHELRTPIAVLISEAQTTLARERSAADYRETVEQCLETAQQMRRLTESLLELARFDAGQEPLNRQPFDLADLTRAVVESIQPLAGRRGVQIHCDLAPCPAFGDADRLVQVITNLVGNAIHYNRAHGEVRVATRVEKGTPALTVSDTGPGIAPEDLPRIFERFYRADKSRGRSEGRCGLGLAISKAIVDGHGGTIEVQSEVGKGSTFTVRLPASAEPTPAA
ncbi:MAG TPA: HAMP domain-containing sensor histidine kinase [Verrucomicrobiae bacterium]|nr:HAMP domain-containing sensor histidine kinase [Verrucomicrobiae bacterium]